MTATETDLPRHDAKYSDEVVNRIRRIVADPAVPFAPDGPIFDPFAGLGDRLREFGRADVFGIEIEPEWSAVAAEVRQGDALNPTDYPALVGAIVTSPCYGNRMADQYLGPECEACKGLGIDRHAKRIPSGSSDIRVDRCEVCNGTGRDGRGRYGYAISLGRKVSDGSAAGLQWGDEYRVFHHEWLGVIASRMAPGPRRLVLNMSDHYRDRKRQYVTSWWAMAARRQGFELVSADRVNTPRMGHGQNMQTKAPEGELLMVFDLIDDLGAR